jgi:hypothetical protein
MNTKLAGTLGTIILLLGIGSFALGHAADAQTMSDKKAMTKVEKQGGDRQKAMEDIANKVDKKMEHFKQIHDKLTHAKFKPNPKAKAR